MIVLDTNIISEVMRPVPDPTVGAWLAEQDPLALATTTITIAEIRRGIARLPKGKKRNSLEERFSGFVDDAFLGRLLAFDKNAAYACGDVAAAREEKGLHADAVDMMIAGIVKSINATLATRNTSDFKECGIALINPWQQSDTSP
ncbi:MAG: type II toxin-antitoxin system VapC family toxin [Rubricoccaceae bacterium]|nr:type II toxin-antitoxin system VapC family toxin [Rubricoccaceae bacterium]